jgi:hypothetical protein
MTMKQYRKQQDQFKPGVYTTGEFSAILGEPKPTPSTRRTIADPNPTFPGRFGLKVDGPELNADWGMADAEYEADLKAKPQPDSYSISTEHLSVTELAYQHKNLAEHLRQVEIELRDTKRALDLALEHYRSAPDGAYMASVFMQGCSVQSL